MTTVEFDHRLAQSGLRIRSVDDSPADEALAPALWRWSEIRPALLRSGELVPMSMTEMRTVSPRFATSLGRSKTVSLGAQVLMPGERTRAHRNLKNETRFIVESSAGGEFIMDGEPFPAEAGDLIVAPTWVWHDHYNGGDKPLVWLDGLDMGLISLANEINIRYQRGQQALEKPEGFSGRLTGHVRPTWIESDHLPPVRYPWRETQATLAMVKENEADIDPFDGIRLMYANPITGGPTVPTFACEIQLLPANVKTEAHRHNSTTVYSAFRGDGVTIAGDTRLEWLRGDIFVVPPWVWHSHENRSRQDAILYSITDWPAMSALGLYREDRG